jgi:hypothetical protein
MTTGIETFEICAYLVGVIAFIAVELLGRRKRRRKDINPPVLFPNGDGDRVE